MIWLSIDPGLRLGVAVWRDSELEDTYTLRANSLEDMAYLLYSGFNIRGASEAVLEDPHFNNCKVNKTLQYIKGMILYILYTQGCRCTLLDPQTWHRRYGGVDAERELLQRLAPHETNEDICAAILIGAAYRGLII